MVVTIGPLQNSALYGIPGQHTVTCLQKIFKTSMIAAAWADCTSAFVEIFVVRPVWANLEISVSFVMEQVFMFMQTSDVIIGGSHDGKVCALLHVIAHLGSLNTLPHFLTRQRPRRDTKS